MRKSRWDLWNRALFADVARKCWDISTYLLASDDVLPVDSVLLVSPVPPVESAAVGSAPSVGCALAANPALRADVVDPTLWCLESTGPALELHSEHRRPRAHALCVARPGVERR